MNAKRKKEKRNIYITEIDGGEGDRKNRRKEKLNKLYLNILLNFLKLRRFLKEMLFLKRSSGGGGGDRGDVEQ